MDRHSVEHPLVLQFDNPVMPPFRLLVQDSWEPWGIAQEAPDGVAIAHGPWYTEICFQLAAPSVSAVLYVVPYHHEDALLLACLGQTVEQFFGYASGDDFGDAITRLVALHWPDVFRMMANGNRPAPPREGRFLCNLQTVRALDWAVGEMLTDPGRNGIDLDRAAKLFEDALGVAVRTGDWVEKLPGVIVALGGPDRAARRLRAVADLLMAGSGLGKAFHGGLQGDELLDLARDLLDVRKGVIGLKD